MILEMIFAPLFFFCRFIISCIPTTSYITDGTSTGVFYDLLTTGLYFFGSAPFVMCIGCVLFWSAIELSWSIIEWLYIKIPGVN